MNHFSLKKQREPSCQLFFSAFRRSLPLMLLLASTACGRPATESECKKIVRAALKAELQEHYSSKELIAQELPRLEAESMAGLLPKCLGQRIRDEQLRCIDRAEAGEVAFDECL